MAVLCLVTHLCLTLFDPMDSSPPGSSVHGDSPGKNTEVDCHDLLQRIFPTQGSNPDLPHCRQIRYWRGNTNSLRKTQISEKRRLSSDKWLWNCTNGVLSTTMSFTCFLFNYKKSMDFHILILYSATQFFSIWYSLIIDSLRFSNAIHRNAYAMHSYTEC